MTEEEETGGGFLLNQLSRILPEGRPEGPGRVEDEEFDQI